MQIVDIKIRTLFAGKQESSHMIYLYNNVPPLRKLDEKSAAAKIYILIMWHLFERN